MSVLDIESAQKEFIIFADKYDMTNERIYMKKTHSLRVMDISKKLAQKENFSEEEVEIAALIGLLHDIARFEQYTQYQTFKDTETFDHGDMGVKILEKNKFLRKFIKTDKYDEIIKIAIKNHNKFAIQEGLTEKQNKFCKLIRDADKLDIFFIITVLVKKQQDEEMENSKLNPKLQEEFKEKKIIEIRNYNKIEHVDKILQLYGFIFDLNYKSSFEIVNEQKYVEKMIEGYKFKDDYTQKQILIAEEETKKYILNKIQD